MKKPATLTYGFKEHHRSAWRQWAIAAALIVPAVFLTLKAAIWMLPEWGTDTESVSVADMQTCGYFVLPASATNVHAHLRAFQDYFLSVRFTIPASDVDAFLQSTWRAGSLDQQTVPDVFDYSSILKWWVTAPPVTFRAVEAQRGGRFQYILIDQSDAELHDVYLVAHDS